MSNRQTLHNILANVNVSDILTFMACFYIRFKSLIICNTACILNFCLIFSSGSYTYVYNSYVLINIHWFITGKLF